MRMPVRAAVAPPAPRRGSLLRDTDHHHAVAAVALGALEILASDLLLHIPLDEPDRRDLVGGDVVVDSVDVVAADLPQHRRRRDREPAIQQEPDHLPFGHQPRHVPLQEQAVDRPDLRASHDRRVGLRSWPRWYLQQPQGAKPRRGFQAGAARPRSRSEGTPRPPAAARRDAPRAGLIPNPDRLQDHRGVRTTARRYEARSLWVASEPWRPYYCPSGSAPAIRTAWISRARSSARLCTRFAALAESLGRIRGVRGAVARRRGTPAWLSRPAR